MKNYIIPIFIPHYGCPNDCVFCNQRKITGVETDVTPQTVWDILQSRLAEIDRPRHIEAAFYGGSFTALPPTLQEEFLQPAHELLAAGKLHSIRLSTRPDCLDDAAMLRLRRYGVETVEIGAQSFAASILRAARRGHTAKDIHSAAAMLKAAGFRLGVQLMVGLPGETWRSVLQTTEETLRLQPDFVRIYPALVLKDTALAAAYASGAYRPLTLPEAVSYSMLMKAAFERRGIAVIRTGLQATEQLADPAVVLAGPYHPSFGELVDAAAYRLSVSRLLEELEHMGAREIAIDHHPRETSKIRGNGNANAAYWTVRHKLKKIVFRADYEQRDAVLVRCGTQAYRVAKNSFYALL